MTVREKQLVRESFAVLKDEAAALASLFYGRLFAMDPSLRPMFHGDIGRQGVKLMEMLAAVVQRVDEMEALTPALYAMGQRHAGYGVLAHHYALAEDALVWALGQALGVSQGSDVAVAWRRLILDVGATMQTGAAQLAEP